ncbi:hypothetical protein [Aquipseudomonas alcaligenes]|nr:hypothetical protein [Pseudomonas alcaligenes]
MTDVLKKKNLDGLPASLTAMPLPLFLREKSKRKHIDMLDWLSE